MSPKQIRKLRGALGLTQRELAERIAGHRVSVARWETGASRPTGAYLKLLEVLAEQLGAKAKKRRG